MCPLSLLPGSSAPAYYDIVPLFSQSIAFNRTRAHWPNWKGLQPPFHQSHRRAGCWVYGAQGGMEELCRVSFFSCTHCHKKSPSFLLSFFLSHCLMPSDVCGNILWEMSILFPINPFLHFYTGVRIDSEEGGRKSTIVSKKNVFIFHLFASYFWDMSYTCAFSFQVCLFNSFVEDRAWKDPSL